MSSKSFDFEPYYCSPRLLGFASTLAQMEEFYSDEVIEQQNFYLILATLQKNRSLWQAKQKEIKDNLGLIAELRSKVWVQNEVGNLLTGKCLDGRTVSQKVSFTTSELDEQQFRSFEKSCRKVVDPLALEYPISLFMRRATFHRIEGAIAAARDDPQKLKSYLASMLFFIRRLEPGAQTKDMVKRWVFWCVDSLVKPGLSELDFVFFLRTFTTLAESVSEDDNFDYAWIPSLCQYPDCDKSPDPMAKCDLALVAFKIICESAASTILLSGKAADPEDEFHVINFNTCTKCEYYILIMKQIPLATILSQFEKSCHTPAEFFSLLSYSDKLIGLISEMFRLTKNVSYAKFFCYGAEIITCVLSTCAKVLENEFRKNSQAFRCYNQLFLDTVKKFLTAKNVNYLNCSDAQPDIMRNTQGIWSFFERLDFRKLSNEGVQLFISQVCLRSTSSDCTCLDDPDCVSNHVEEFVNNFYRICAYSDGYVQCEKDGVALLKSLVSLTETSDTNCSRNGHIVDFVASSLWRICFASAELQKSFCAHGYQLLKSLTIFHPHTIDYFITWTSQHTDDPFVVSVASKIFQYIKLDSWKISPGTIESLSKFLELPSESSLNPVSRFLLEKINWKSPSKKSSNSEDLTLKLEVVRIVAIRYFESVNESTERKLASFYNDHSTKLNEKAEFALWCWQLIPNLDIEIEFGCQMPLMLSQLMSENLSFMHYLHLWMYKNIDYHPMDSLLGFRHLQFLLENEFYIPVLSILDNVLYRYDRDSQDSIRNLYRIFDRICYGDKTVIGSSNNNNTKLLASLLVNLANKHLESIGFQVALKALLVEQEFIFNERLMLILDHLCNYLFFKQRLQKVMIPKLTEFFLKQYTPNTTSKGSGRDSIVSSKSLPYQPLIQKPDYKYPYLNYACLLAQINFERIAKFWTSIVEVAKTEIESSADELIYRAKLSSTIIYNCSVSSDNLAIHFCYKLITNTDPNNLVYLHLWRHMMTMYFHYDKHTNQVAVIGDRFFKKLIGFSPVKKMAASAAKAADVEFSSSSRIASYRRNLFLNTCKIWLLSPALKGYPVHVSDLSFEHDTPNMMDLIFNKKQSFFAHMDLSAQDVFTEQFFKSLSAILNPDLKESSASSESSEQSSWSIELSLELPEPSKFRIPPNLESLREPFDPIEDDPYFEDTINRIKECLKLITGYSKSSISAMQNFENRLSKLKKQLKDEYENRDTLEYVEVTCNNVFRKSCSGPALIEWKYTLSERKTHISDIIDALIFELQQEFTLMYMKELDNFVESGEFLSFLIHQLVKMSTIDRSGDGKNECSVNKVFFMLVDSVHSSRFLNFAPFSAIFENCLQILGPRCVKNADFSARVLKDMVEKTFLVPLLSSFFDVDQSIFVDAYIQILQASASGSLTGKTSSNLLKKFDFASWLNSKPSFADMKKLVVTLLNYFVKMGRKNSSEIIDSVPMSHFLDINSSNPETLLEICFPAIFEIECNTSGLTSEFYEEFLACCEKSHSNELLPDIMNSIVHGLNSNDKVCFKSEGSICCNLMKSDLLYCMKAICFQYISSLGSTMDFTSSIFDLEAAIENAWDNLTQIFDNFWLQNSIAVKVIDPSAQCSYHEHVETFVQCVNKLQICFHKIRPTLDIGFCGARYKNALNFLIERAAMLKVDPSIFGDFPVETDKASCFLEDYFEGLCWSIFMPGLGDPRNLNILFDSDVFHTLAVQVFVSVNWSAFYAHHDTSNHWNANECLNEILDLALKFYFKNHVKTTKFLVFSEWNMDHESSSADQVTLDDAIINLQEVDWSKLETDNLREIVNQWECSMTSDFEMRCSDNSFVKLFFSVVETSNGSLNYENGQCFMGKPHVFVETLCRLIFKNTQESELHQNVVFLLNELKKRYPLKYLRITLLTSIFEQSSKVPSKSLARLSSAISTFLSSNNLTENDFLWFFESVSWSISNLSYLCEIAEMVIDNYFACNDVAGKNKSSFQPCWEKLQPILDQTSFTNYRAIFEICAKHGHSFLLFLLSKSSHDRSIEYFVQSITKIDLLVLAEKKRDHKLVVIYYRLLYLNRTENFPVGSSSTKNNNPAKAVIHLLMQVCDINLFDKIRAKFGLHAGSLFSMDFRVISKCLLIYILRVLPANLREGSFPKHLDLLGSLRRFLTTFPSSSVVDFELLIDLCICSDSYQPVFYMLITNFYSKNKALTALLG